MYLTAKAVKAYNCIVDHLESEDLFQEEPKSKRFFVEGCIKALIAWNQITQQEACSILIELLKTDLI